MLCLKRVKFAKEERKPEIPAAIPTLPLAENSKSTSSRKRLTERGLKSAPGASRRGLKPTRHGLNARTNTNFFSMSSRALPTGRQVVERSNKILTAENNAAVFL